MLSKLDEPITLLILLLPTLPKKKVSGVSTLKMLLPPVLISKFDFAVLNIKSDRTAPKMSTIGPAGKTPILQPASETGKWQPLSAKMMFALTLSEPRRDSQTLRH